MAFGLIFVLPRTDNGTRIRPIRTRRGEVDPAKIIVLVGLVCLLLYPVLGIVLRVVTSSMLEARGYRGQIVETSGHSGYLEMKWARTNAVRPTE